MAGVSEAFQSHVASGLTTLCRCWLVTRSDGVRFGFTDHDRDLRFESAAEGEAGLLFRAGTGLTARSLQQVTGLAVDNTEALGALSDAAIREDEIEAGRFDGAEVRCWLVNWADVSVRWLQFRGSFGQIRRAGGAFEAELRGLTEALNQPMGRIYQKPCTAVLGDGACRFDMTTPGYTLELAAEEIREGQYFGFAALPGFEPNWFTSGRLTVMSGAASGLWGWIKQDRQQVGRLGQDASAPDPNAEHRQLTLWEPLRAQIRPGDLLHLAAGCDKRLKTCRLKFNNGVNFQGFPDIPGEDWVMSVPRQSGNNTGGSRR
ncbi:DUF2163 domain-containing protein [Phaeobacter inhibens]|uniref:DUF2163 domain-containing protein n=1 Tax=Phaeobacter inhibens TaxID=221822 RepID=UPI0003F918F7|nr:DUF2163 domain-containing protein [Phaeobacter inhibens]